MSLNTTAVAPLMCMTVTRSPGSNTSLSLSGRAVHTWPSSFTWPSSRATRSSTSADLPSSALMPVGNPLAGANHRRVGPERPGQQPAAPRCGQRAAGKHQQGHIARQRLGTGKHQREYEPDHRDGHAVRIRVIRLCGTKQLHSEIMWCPSVSLSLWANAWLAGKAAPDDVLDALSVWAP